MKKEEILELFTSFESAAAEIEGVECWSARDLQILLGYSKWENFEKVIQKAKESCKNAGEEIADHFPDVRKVIEAGKGAKQNLDDIALTRYACYLHPRGVSQRGPCGVPGMVNSQWSIKKFTIHYGLTILPSQVAHFGLIIKSVMIP